MMICAAVRPTPGISSSRSSNATLRMPRIAGPCRVDLGDRRLDARGQLSDLPGLPVLTVEQHADQASSTLIKNAWCSSN